MLAVGPYTAISVRMLGRSPGQKTVPVHSETKCRLDHPRQMVKFDDLPLSSGQSDTSGGKDMPRSARIKHIEALCGHIRIAMYRRVDALGRYDPRP